MKTKNDNIITAYGGMPIVNVETGEFFRPYSDDQKKVIKEALSNKLPIRAVADLGLPAATMRFLYQKAYVEHYNPRFGLHDIELWKLIHSPLIKDTEKCEYCIIAMCNGVYMLDEIENIEDYSKDILKIVAESAVKGKNICSKVTPTTGLSELISYM